MINPIKESKDLELLFNRVGESCGMFLNKVEDLFSDFVEISTFRKILVIIIVLFLISDVISILSFFRNTVEGFHCKFQYNYTVYNKEKCIEIEESYLNYIFRLNETKNKDTSVKIQGNFSETGRKIDQEEMLQALFGYDLYIKNKDRVLFEESAFSFGGLKYSVETSSFPSWMDLGNYMYIVTNYNVIDNNKVRNKIVFAVLKRCGFLENRQGLCESEEDFLFEKSIVICKDSLKVINTVFDYCE